MPDISYNICLISFAIGFAIDILTTQSPGFGTAWQNAFENSKQEIAQFATGVKPFIRNIAKNLLPEEID